MGINAAGCRTHRRFCRDADGADGGEDGGAGRLFGEGHPRGGAVAEVGRDDVGAFQEQREVHVSVAAVVRGIDQPGFWRQRRLGDERVAHRRRYRLRLLVQAVAAGDVRLQLIDAVATFAGAGFGVVVAEEATARRQAEVAARDGFAVAVNDVNVPQPRQRRAVFQRNDALFPVARVTVEQVERVMAAVIHRFLPRAGVADVWAQCVKGGSEDGIEQRAAFDRAGGDEGEREQYPALGEQRLLPGNAGIARGEDGVQRDRPAFSGRQGGGNRAVVQGVGHGGGLMCWLNGYLINDYLSARDADEPPSPPPRGERGNRGATHLSPSSTGEGVERRNFTQGFTHRNIREGNKGSKNNGAAPSPCGGGRGWGWGWGSSRLRRCYCAFCSSSLCRMAVSTASVCCKTSLFQNRNTVRPCCCRWRVRCAS